MITAHQACINAETFLAQNHAPMTERLKKALNFLIIKKSNSGKFQVTLKIKKYQYKNELSIQHAKFYYESLGYTAAIRYPRDNASQSYYAIYLDWSYPNEKQKEGLNKW